MTKWKRGARIGASLALALGCLASCQAVFTFSPLSFLRREPASLDRAQQVEYALLAIEGGDEEAVAEAYDIISVAADADAEDAELQYTAAQLALDLSGVDQVFSDALATLAGGDGGDALAVSDEVFAALDLGMLADAGEYLLAADSAEVPADLTATDYLIGAVGLLIAGAPVDPASSDAAPDIVATVADNANLDEAEAFLVAGIGELPADDPARAILQALLDSLQGGGA